MIFENQGKGVEHLAHLPLCFPPSVSNMPHTQPKHVAATTSICSMWFFIARLCSFSTRLTLPTFHFARPGRIDKKYTSQLFCRLRQASNSYVIKCFPIIEGSQHKATIPLKSTLARPKTEAARGHLLLRVLGLATRHSVSELG